MKKAALKKFFVGKYMAYKMHGRSSTLYDKITGADKIGTTVYDFHYSTISKSKLPTYRIEYGKYFAEFDQSALTTLIKEKEYTDPHWYFQLLSPKQFVVANANVFIGCRYLLSAPSDYLTIEDITSNSTYPYCVAVRVRRGSFITRTETFYFPYTFFENALLSVDPRHYDNGRMRLTTL